jgi:hypothetical protein
MVSDVLRNRILRDARDAIAYSHTRENLFGQKLIDERDRNRPIAANLARGFGLIN